ncbi:MAG TPA: hypothetical protein VLE43_00220 [Candidatus Saccharimonadia bacterium]|nr:hypothetical protein [Candidatus Saccharimonadia bacterium]
MIKVSLTFLVFLPFLLAGIVFLWAHARMILHETAHCLAARMVGFHPLQMEWGTGEKGWRFRFLDLPVVWHSQPWNGITHCRWASLEGLRWGGPLYILAGTAVDVALLLLVAWVNRYAEATFEEPPLWYWFTNPLFFWQWLTLMFTLIPMDLQIEEWKSATDGKELFQFLSGGMARTARTQRESYLTGMRRYQPTLTFEECWLYRPNMELVRRLIRTSTAFQEGRINDALALAEELLTLAPMAPGERAQLLDVMANSAGLTGKRWDLGRALAWAREAHALVPDARPVQGTLGALLVEKGEIPEAVSLLEPLTTSENHPDDQVTACCYLAKASDNGRDRSAVHQWLVKARAIQPTHPLIAQVETELGISLTEALAPRHGPVRGQYGGWVRCKPRIRHAQIVFRLRI